MHQYLITLQGAWCTPLPLKVTNMTKKETVLEGGKLLIEVVEPAKISKWGQGGILLSHISNKKLNFLGAVASPYDWTSRNITPFPIHTHTLVGKLLSITSGPLVPPRDTAQLVWWLVKVGRTLKGLKLQCIHAHCPFPMGICKEKECNYALHCSDSLTGACARRCYRI